jgi:dolichol-phosphate mannosyltransferase
VLIIDADLQDPPELLPQLMARMDEGFDVVYARRRSRASEGRLKLFSAHLYYRVLGRLSEVEIPHDTGDFRLMSRRIVERLNQMPEQDRFLRGMVAWIGGAQTELLYEREARFAGASGYTLFKMLRLAMAGVTSFSTLPLRLAGLMAALGRRRRLLSASTPRSASSADARFRGGQAWRSSSSSSRRYNWLRSASWARTSAVFSFR